MSTEIAIVGNKFFPGLGDWYLGRTGFKSQQTSHPKSPNQPDDLYQPADTHRDFGAHGEFDAKSKPRSLQLWAVTHRPWLAAGAAAAGVGMALAGLGRAGR